MLLNNKINEYNYLHKYLDEYEKEIDQVKS